MTIGPRCIFLAEDDEDDCLIFLEALQELGCTDEVIVTRDGEQLMDHLSRVPRLPYVLFLDLNMPRKNGFECLKEIKETAEFKSIPVVVLSTSTEPEDIKLAYELGATLYISKARSFTEFVKRIEKVIHSDLLQTEVAFNEFVLRT